MNETIRQLLERKSVRSFEDREIGPAETEAIRQRSAVEAENWPYSYEDGILTVKAALGVNDVYGFVIR